LALAGLGGGSQHPFDLSLSLAAARPTASPSAPVRFRRDHLPVLKQAAEALRARAPEGE